MAFDVGGVREWLEDGVCGFVVPEKDIAAMASKLECLYENKAVAAEMGAAGRRRIMECFSSARFLASVQELVQGAAK